jgi:glycosyltransferase involved in cell wall biosynthesis
VNPRPRVLLVKPVVPYPPDQGTKLVSFAIVEALAETCDVTVLARTLGPDDDARARELGRACTRVVTVRPGSRRNFFTRVLYRLAYTLRSLATGRSLKSLYDCPGTFIRAARALAREPFDLVIVEYWQLYPLLRVFDPARTVLLTHDIDLLVNRDRALLERGLFARAAALWRWRVEQREEVKAYQAARRVWALTEKDAGAVRRLSRDRAEVAVLPFGLPESRFAPVVPARTGKDVLFLGALGAAFNRDALDHFVRDIHPHLAGIEGIRFTVVGGTLPEDLAFFGRLRNVEVPGHIVDVAPYLARAACLVVPLRYAGGLRIRIIEAMAAGLPVVASPVAVEGMDLEPGRHVLVAGDPAGYRAHIERLLSDRVFAATLAAEASERARAAWGPRARGEGIREAARRLLAGRGGGPGAG